MYIDDWLEEKCVIRKSVQDTSARLYTSWQTWAEARGKLRGNVIRSQKRFAMELESLGFEKIRIGHSNSRGWRGIMCRQT